jgi:hypothetical protein
LGVVGPPGTHIPPVVTDLNKLRRNPVALTFHDMVRHTTGSTSLTMKGRPVLTIWGREFNACLTLHGLSHR